MEQADSVQANASAVVAAATALAKINSNGQWVDKVEQVNLNELFDRMSAEELERYAATGDLPNWFRQTVAATVSDSQEESVDG